MRAAGKQLNPLVVELQRAFENLKGIIAQLDYNKDGPRLLVSAVSAGACPEAREAILSQTPLAIRQMIKRWLETGKVPKLLRAVSPVKVDESEMIRLSVNGQERLFA